MNYELVKDVMDLVEQFQKDNHTTELYSNDIEGFREWFRAEQISTHEAVWEGKKEGRTPESLINTLLVHMNHYAKSYAKSAIYGSDFSTQDDFIFLINLKAFGAMTKMELIKINKQEKPVGIKIINRLIANGWVEQKKSDVDKRSKIINITKSGLNVLNQQMEKIRKATKIVTGNLNANEKMQLIHLLQKLDGFHQELYAESIEPSELIDVAFNKYLELKPN